MKKGNFLFYGPPGGGKTTLGLSSFYDYRQNKLIRDGRWLRIGGESNTRMVLPDANVKHFTSPDTNPLEFSEQFDVYTKALVAQAYKGKGPEVVFMDGLSEFNLLDIHEFTQKHGIGDDKWARYDYARDQFIGAIKRLRADTLNAFVIMSARVDTRRKGILNKKTGELTGDDPVWMDTRYVPAAAGFVRDNLGYYFDLIAYVDSDPGMVVLPDGTQAQGDHHKVYMRQGDNYLVKNVWADCWTVTKRPDYLTNPTFDDIVHELEASQVEATAIWAASKKGSETK